MLRLYKAPIHRHLRLGFAYRNYTPEQLILFASVCNWQTWTIMSLIPATIAKRRVLDRCDKTP